MKESWYTREVHDLFASLPFQIVFPIILALWLGYYCFSLSREQVLGPKSKPYTGLVYFDTSLIILLTFLSIGPWVLETRFWILFIFQVLQLFVYSVLAFCLLSNFGQTRFMCIAIKV